ncbi:hypothetical protein HYW20_00495 [Candidatus Woesearchaeota archaeon]|nr:hypothetical protein [Candidatus Woesearchaeota archaeon]
MNKQELIRKYKTTNVKIPNLPDKNAMLAELVGIILGDGNIHVYPNNGLYALRIAGNAVKDYDYLTTYVFNLCMKLFSIRPRIYKQPRVDCIYLIIQSIIVTDFLLSMGLKEGNKIKSQITIPDWVIENDVYLKACIRGLIDTDGCVYEMLPHWPGLFQINFENRNITLLKDTRKALIKLGYNPSRICGKRTINGTKCYISRKEKIKKFYKEVGSSNDRNIKQFNKVLNS